MHWSHWKEGMAWAWEQALPDPAREAANYYALYQAVGSWNLHGKCLPAGEPVDVVELAMLHSVFMNQFRNLHVEAAVFRDFHDFPLSPPAEGIQSLRGLADSERRRGDGVQGQAVPGGFLHHLKHV